MKRLIALAIFALISFAAAPHAHAAEADNYCFDTTATQQPFFKPCSPTVPMATTATVTPATDTTATGSITSTQNVPITTAGQSCVTAEVSTFSGVLAIEASADNATWVATTGVSLTTGTIVANITGTGSTQIVQINSAGMNIRLRGIPVTAGTAAITLRAAAGVCNVMADNPFPIITNLVGVTATDRGGTLTAGGTAQNAAGANTARRFFVIENPCTAAGEGIAATEDLYVAVTGSATVGGAGNYADLAPCGSTTVVVNGQVITSAISVNATTIGHRWSATEGQ